MEGGPGVPMAEDAKAEPRVVEADLFKRCFPTEWMTGWWQLKYFWNFHPENWGNDSHFDEHIFQRGWNHQLDDDAILMLA